MGKSRFTETEIVSILTQADAGGPVKELCREHRISRATHYKWNSKYGGIKASDLKRVKELEISTENRPGRGFQERWKLIPRRGHPWNDKRFYRMYQ